FQVFIAGITGALRDAENEFGMTSKLIMCFLRHLSEESALETLDLAVPYLDHIAGVGLDSSEVGHPPSKFANVFKRAGDMGLLRVAHAGEEGPPSYVWEAIDLLKVDRIDHGNRSLEDSKLVARLVEANMTLTVCPLSNTQLCVVKDMADHPLKEMLDCGLRATINSDDPAYFGGYLNDNYRAVAGALALTKDDLTTLAINSFLGSFLSPDEKAVQIERVTNYADSFEVGE
ncbi:MAG: adenosine deaminase, partial [Woeseia sp.]